MIYGNRHHAGGASDVGVQFMPPNADTDLTHLQPTHV